MRTPVLLLALVLWLPQAVTAQYFGRNKVQYRSFDFQIIRTEHFDVYYYDREREAVMDAARMIERSYARLSKLLQHEFRERKPVILYASHTDFQQTNALPGFMDESTGGVTEASKSRIIMPFTGTYADFDHVLTHELVHAFQYDVILRRGVLNEAMPFGARLPLWFMEGMAEYLSIGRTDPLTVSWLRDAVLHGYLRDIAEMTRRDDYLSYRFGQSLWAYIGGKYGDEVVGILLQKAPRIGLERAFSSTLGISLQELSDDWIASIRTTYLPQVAIYSQPQSFSQKVTHHDALGDPWFLAPSISPDGNELVYLSQRDGFYFDLWLADARSGKPKRKLVAGSGEASYESLRYMYSGTGFSRDGRYIVFAAQSGGRDVLNVYDNRAKRVVRRLRFDVDGITSPAFSPDGRNIVFTGLYGGHSDLYITDLNGRLRRLTSDRYADLLPSWSPDGTHIAFTTDRGPATSFDRLTYGNFRVALYSVQTGEIRLLPHQDAGKNMNPVWAPDSKSLVWVNDASGTNNLHLFDLEEQALYRITDLLSGVLAVTPTSPVLSWSASGRLAYVYFEKAGYNIYTIDDPRTLPRVPVAAPVLATADVTAGDEGSVSATTAVDPDRTAGRVPLDADSPVADVPGRTFGGTHSFYRSGRSIRPSADTVAAADIAPILSVTALLDSAMMALPDTTAFEHRDYKVRFTPDMIGRPTIGAQVGGYYGNGLYGGSFITLSDMLGNHNIVAAASVNGSLSDASFYTAYNRMKSRANIGLSLQQLPLYRYYGTDYMRLDVKGREEDVWANVFLRDVIRSAAAYVSYPFSQFQRMEFGASAVYYKSDVVYRGRTLRTSEPFQVSDRIDDLSYIQPMTALVFDNTLFGWTGPVFGRRYRLQLSRTLGNFEFTEGMLDFRNYVNWQQKIVLATRFMSLTRYGTDADRFGVYWGGPYYVRGYDATSFDLDGDECTSSRFEAGDASVSMCPVRDQLIGSSAALMNAELRVPIIRELQIGFLGAFPPVDLVTFLDGGVAWDGMICNRTSPVNPRVCDDGASQDVRFVLQRKPGQDPYLYRQPLFSYGLGLRFNVFYTVLRLDYAVPVSRPNRTGFTHGVFSVSFGPSF